jgi:hypothetical protein
MKIGVSFQLRFEEYRLAMRLLSRGRVSLWYAVAGFVVLGTGLLAVGHGTQGIGAAFLAVAGVYAVLLTFGADAWSKRRFATRCEPTEILFEEGHFAVATEHTRVEVRWPGVTDVLETPELFLLYRSKRVAVIVPTRAFDADQLGAFRAFLSRRTSPHPRPPAPLPGGERIRQSTPGVPPAAADRGGSPGSSAGGRGSAGRVDQSAFVRLAQVLRHQVGGAVDGHGHELVGRRLPLGPAVAGVGAGHLAFGYGHGSLLGWVWSAGIGDPGYGPAPRRGQVVTP